MALKNLKSRIPTADLSIAKTPEKVADEFYSSSKWKLLRHACLERDHYRCTVPGCTNRATFADHKISRRIGGPDDLSNLRSLCAGHDAQVKENHLGERRSGGAFRPLK